MCISIPISKVILQSARAGKYLVCNDWKGIQKLIFQLVRELSFASYSITYLARKSSRSLPRICLEMGLQRRRVTVFFVHLHVFSSTFIYFSSTFKCFLSHLHAFSSTFMCFFRPPSCVLFLFCFDDEYKRREGIASTDSVGRAMSLAYFAASTEVGGGEGDRPRLQGASKSAAVKKFLQLSSPCAVGALFTPMNSWLDEECTSWAPSLFCLFGPPNNPVIPHSAMAQR